MQLLGYWVIDPTDDQALAEFGNVSLSFKENGELLYTITSAAKDEIIRLRYVVEGSTLITDQPSHPSVERTEYSISSNGTLTLAIGGKLSRFIRHAK